jgi:outer membrane scaffolding protein for murein synthesis (MipA/OmpV family)
MFTRNLSSVVTTVLAIAALTAHPSWAAQGPKEARATAGRPAGPPLGWSKEFGAAVIVNPSFQGSSSYDVQPVPYFDFRYRDELGVKYFANVPQGIGGYLYRHRNKDGSRSAVSLALAPGFANRDADDIDGLDTFGPSAEARLGWEYSTGPWSLNASLSQALGSGHEGLYGQLSASWRQRIGRRGFLSVGPTLRFGNDRYMDAFYGVTAAEAGRTGLGTFEAQAGLESAGVQGILSVPIIGQWRATTVMQLSVLTNDAADSTLTARESQAFFLTAITRQF